MTNSICLPGECRGHFFEVVSDIENYPCFPSCFYFFHLCTGISNRLDFRFNQVLCVIKFSPSQLYLQFPIVEINNFATVRYKLFAIKQIKQLPQKLISKSAISEPSTVIFFCRLAALRFVVLSIITSNKAWAVFTNSSFLVRPVTSTPISAVWSKKL